MSDLAEELKKVLDAAKKVHQRRFPKGERGLKGDKGDPGDPGEQGPPGERGLRGLAGKDGKLGEQGFNGPIGPMPKHEIKGLMFRFEIAPNEWGKWITVPTGGGGGGGTAKLRRYEDELVEIGGLWRSNSFSNVYVSDTAPASPRINDVWLDTSGTNVVTKTSDYSATVTDYTILCDASGGDITITLPSASTFPGHGFQIKKIDSTDNIVTIEPTSPDVIDGETSVLTVEQWTNIMVQSDGTNWYIL